MNAVRGQAISVQTENISQVIHGDVTIFPTVNGQSVVSGTYARSRDTRADADDTGKLMEAAGKLATLSGATAEQVYVGIRAVPRDRLPIVDGVPDWQALAETTINRVSAFNVYQQGLSVCAAFGSRGATHARLCAEHLVSKLLGEPAALDLNHQRMLSASRFSIRDAHQTRGR